MNDLLREQAPISAEAWREIDAEAKRTLKTLLAARRLVDFEGPLGWAVAAVPSGRAEKLSPPLQEGAVTRLRGELLDGPIVWAPAANGAVVMSLRGGDFELTVGQDFSVGYLDHTSTSVLLYLQETFTFRVLTPQASVPLTYPAADAKVSD